MLDVQLEALSDGGGLQLVVDEALVLRRVPVGHRAAGPSECGAAPLSAEAIEGYVDQLAAAGLDGAQGREVETELLARLKARRAEPKLLVTRRNDGRTAVQWILD